MKWLQTHQRSALIVALTLAAPIVLYLVAVTELLAMQRGYSSEMERMLPRVARLQGLKAFEDKLRVSSEIASKRASGIVYSANADARSIAASLQTSVRQIFVDAGLSVTNSQVLPTREQGAFEYIGLNFTVTGDLSSLDEALGSVARLSPIFLVESLDVVPVRTRNTKEAQEQKVNASVQLVTLRAIQ